jgi:hypothetical protein
MDHRDEWFSPESVEEQIERHLYAPDQLSPNARLLHDLQHLALDDVGRLVRIRARLFEHDSANIPPVPLQRHPSLPKQEFWQPYLMQPEQRQKRRIGKFFAIACGAMVLLLSIVAAISHAMGSGPSSGHTPATVGQRPTVVSTAGIQLGPQTCPSAVQSGAHWESIMGTSATQKVEGVLCGYLMGVPTLQAVVKVRYGGADGQLDIAVYANITSAHPSRIFLLQGLPHGDVGISNYNTLLTDEIELKPGQPAGVPPAPVQQDLSREFKWSDSAGTLVQIAFQGLYPDLTRYQAEFEQGQVNTGQGFQQWRLSAVTTAQHFAEFVLGWDPNAPTTVISGGGTHDAKALILVKNPSAGGATIKLSLSRLERNTNGGIWEVTGVATDGLSIASPQYAQQVTSPVQVRGVNTALTGKPTTIKVFDHDRTEIGQATVTQPGGIGKPNISTSIPFSSSFQGETQEGIIALYAYMGNHVIAGAVMVKVLLSA